MNRIAVLNVVKQAGGHSRLEGRVGDVTFVVRRDQGLDDRWLLFATPSQTQIPEKTVTHVPFQARSQRARAEMAAREIIERFGNIDLNDPIDDLFADHDA